VHTAIVIGIGFALLAACVLLGRLVGGAAALSTSVMVFLPLWLIGAAVNMAIGVKKAGYSVADEAPVFLLVFGIPALVALFLRWRFWIH
jgi:hypothetical protein